MDPTSPNDTSGSAGSPHREAPSSPPESMRGAGSDRKSAAAPAAPPATAAAEVGPVVELHHSRRSSGRTSWLWVALPIAGLLVVPMIGLVYAATSTFGKGAPDPSASAPLDDDDEPGEPGSPLGKTGTKKPKRTTSGSRASKNGSKPPRSDSAAACCTKLHELGKTSPLDVRAPYLSAAAACDAAPDADKAFLRVKGNLRATKAEIPEECEP